jgi:hypothetical protein
MLSDPIKDNKTNKKSNPIFKKVGVSEVFIEAKTKTPAR